jgi:hypothetical protein
MAAALAWKSVPAMPSILDGALADSQSELQQFSPNALCPPGAVLLRHLLDQGYDVAGRWWFATSAFWPRLAPPHPPEQIPVPAEYGLELNDHQRLLPGSESACQQHKQGSVAPGQCWSLILLYHFLLAACQVDGGIQDQSMVAGLRPLAKTLLG